MATKVLTDPQHYTNIANAIREKNGSSTVYTPADMANAILGIETGGGGSESGGIVSGVFTPTSDNNISGGMITVDPPDGKRIAALFVYDTNKPLSGTDNYSPALFAIASYIFPVNFVEQYVYNGSLTAYGKARSDVDSVTHASEDAIGSEYAVNIYNDIARFKTYGPYAFRVGRTYRYVIVYADA